MTTEAIAPGLSELPATAVQPELLMSSVLHLMSHYTAHADEKSCTRLASVIERHLKVLAELPELAPVLRATCRQLAEQWESVVQRAMPVPEKPRRFRPFALGGR